MANKYQVIELHKKNPDWTAADIAKALNCMPEYVRKTADRNGFSLPLKYQEADPIELRQRAARLIARAERIERKRSN